MLDDPARLTAVAAATAAVTRAPLDRLTGLAARLTDSRFGFVSLVAGDVEVLTAAAGRAAAALPAALPVAQSICQHLVRSGGQLLVPDLDADARYADLLEVRALGMRGYAGSPVTSPTGAVLGGLCVADDVPRAWTPAEGLLLGDLAAAASAALASAVVLQELERARDQERRRADEQAALHRIAASVVRGDLPERVLQQAADELVALLDATAALVLRFRPDGGTTVVVTAGPVSVTASAWSWFGRLVADVRGGGSSVLAQLEDAPCAAVPLEVGGRTWGALVLVLGPEGSRGRVRQLEQLADVVALVLVNAEAQLQLTRLARTDPLTGAANRRVYEERLGDELVRCGRTGGQVVVALLDLDHFKQVNDVHGHAVGDDVLRALVERLGDLLREGDLLARLGGDEWGLLLPDAAHDAPGVLERVRAAVAAEPLAGVPMTVTVGAVVVGAGASRAEAARRADAALYAAKREGRDRVRLD